VDRAHSPDLVIRLAVAMQVEHEVEDVGRRRGDSRGRFANDHGDERKPRNRR